MKKLVLALVPLMLLFTTESGATAIKFEAALSGLAEAPPNASPGTGEVTVLYNPGLQTLRILGTFADLVGTTTLAHIHCCVAPPGTASPATTTPTLPFFPVGVTSGAFDGTLDLTLASSYNGSFITANGGTTAGAEAALVAGLDAGRAYFNIHTTAFGGGEIRGFLQRVPEPGTMALLAIALGALAAQRKRRPATITRSTFCR